MEPPQKKRVSGSAAWREARELVWTHRRRLTIGLALMLVSRLMTLVLPSTSKFLIDDVVGKGRTDLLLPIALVAGVLGVMIVALTAHYGVRRSSRPSRIAA